MGQRILVLQHSEWQRPGPIIRQAAKDHKVELHITRVWQESAADFADFDALILLGAPFHLDQEGEFPFLREEKRLVRAWMNLDRPCLGFNMGQHLIAEAAGAEIGPCFVHRTGFIEGHLTHEGRKHPVFQGVRSPLSLFKWQTQEIRSPLPRNIVLLATSKDCMVEACCLLGRPHIVGLQCDNYAGIPDDMAVWARRSSGSLAPRPNDRFPAAELLESANDLAAEIAATTHLLIRNFISLLNR